LPFQCKIRVCSCCLEFLTVPTAQTLAGETERTLIRSLERSLGMDATVQARPFQCSIRACSTRLLSLLVPTAQASVADGAVTLAKLPSMVSGDGCAPAVHRQAVTTVLAGARKVKPVSVPASAAEPATTARTGTQRPLGDLPCMPA
jgi:hypothetical protein